MKLVWDDSTIKLGCCDWCGHPLNTLERISDKALGCSLKWWPRLVEACLTLMTVDHRNELLVMDHSVMVVALRLPWFAWIITVMPVWLYFSSFMFCSVLFFNMKLYIYYARVGCVWFLYCRYAYNLTEHEYLENLGCQFCFLFEEFFISVHIIITSITGLGMFTNLCLVLLVLLGSLLVANFHFQLTKQSQSKRKVQEMVGHSNNWQKVWRL